MFGLKGIHKYIIRDLRDVTLKGLLNIEGGFLEKNHKRDYLWLDLIYPKTKFPNILRTCLARGASDMTLV